MIKKTPAITVQELINFVKQEDRYPSQNASGNEKSLAQAIANFKSKKRFSDEELKIVDTIQRQYSDRQPKLTLQDKYQELYNFCIKYKRWPSQDSKDEYEKKLYNKCRRSYFEKDSSLLHMYDELCENYKNEKSSEKVLEDLERFINNNFFFPRESSSDEEEEKLAICLKSRKCKQSFNEAQLERLKQLHVMYGPNKGTSIWEQIIFQYLQYQLGNANVLNRNKQFCDAEIDVLIQLPNIRNRKIAIFYDGAYYHSKSSSLNRDNEVNQKLNEENFSIYRFREKGCPGIDTYANMEVVTVDVKNTKDFLDNVVHPFFCEKFAAWGLDIKESYDDDWIISRAKISSSSRYRIKRHLLDYIEECIMKEEKTTSSSKSYRNCKKIISNNGFSKNEQLLYGFVKRLYDRNTRKHKIDVEASLFNDDIVLLKQIIDVIYLSTAYDKKVFKAQMIKLLNDLDYE